MLVTVMKIVTAVSVGGYEQELDFKSADKVVVHVFEKSVETRMRIDAEKEPVQMDLSVPDAGAGAQDIYYICKVGLYYSL